jgi:hypothetical protein
VPIAREDSSGEHVGEVHLRRTPGYYDIRVAIPIGAASSRRVIARDRSNARGVADAERRGMRRTRLYRTIVVVGATLAGGTIVGSTSTLAGCDIYFEPTSHHGSGFGIIDASSDSYWFIDASDYIDAWNPIADAPIDGGVKDAS